MTYPPELEQAVHTRLAQTHAQTLNSLRRIAEGNPLAAEPDPDRLVLRLQSKTDLPPDEAEAIAAQIQDLAERAADDLESLVEAEAIYGPTVDFVGVSFLERGMRAARSVARVAYLDGRPQGSGFLVSDQLFLTNHHVIQSAAHAKVFAVEFDYEKDTTGTLRGPTRFLLDPDVLYLSDPVDGLDYALIAVGRKITGPGNLADYAWCPLSGAGDKHALGEVANIVQHPDGRYKEVVLRENSLVARLDFVLHYVADTEPGSSGSPVFNNEWQAIALHHWGGPWLQRVDEFGRPLPREINEGIRVSAIVQDLLAKRASLSPAQQRLLDDVLASQAATPPAPQPADFPETLLAPDGSITWRIPIEISVRLPILDRSGVAIRDGFVLTGVGQASPSTDPLAEASIRPSKDFSNRGGYKEKFIEGFVVPLPELSESQRLQTAPNRQAQPGDDPFELKYHHFSVVMNAERRLAFFTACNIDGSQAKHVNRTTGQVTALSPDDTRLEALAAAEAAEASDTWYNDDRLDPEHYAGKSVYDKQLVPGFPTPTSPGRILRMFQRGHLVRRMDPAWGTDDQAKLADADTFHWTNCSPQVGFFNMGRAPASTPGSGRGLLWRAAENYVLKNAVAEKLRVCSFTGPVFSPDDRPYRTIRVPKKFWKIVVWAQDNELRSLAMIVDQSRVIEVWPEALSESLEEAYGDADELALVEDFLSTITDVEALTGLDFGEAVRAADIRAGETTAPVADPDELDKQITTSPKKTTAKRKPRRR